MTAVVDSYELSPMQAGMLFHGLSARDPGVDIEQVIATLREPLDEAHFLRAWDRVVERHAILRTRFRWEDVAQPVQEVLDRVQIPVERFDWRGFDEAERHRRLQALVERERIRSFDLDRAPLMRLALLRVDEREHWMLWTFHHILLDGRSRLLVLQELFAFYEAFARGTDIELPPPRPYRDYLEWLRTLDEAPAKAYWRERLADFSAATPLAVPRDRIADAFAGSVSGVHETRLPAALTSALRKRAREASITLNVLLQGAWALLLHRYSGESDIVFGATRACRPPALHGAASIVGLFINTLPVRVAVDPEAEVATWLRLMRAQQSALREHEHTPLAKVQAWSEVPRGTPLFETIVVFDTHTLDAQLRGQGGAWSERRFSNLGQTNFPLTLAAYGDQELLLQLEYSRQRFADDAVARMLGHLRTLLEGIATHPQAKLKELPLLSEAEREQVLVQWNDTAVDYPSARCAHEMFEEQARIRPDALAAQAGAKRMTYRALDDRAEALAQQLRMLGVGSNSLVALYLERSIEMLIGILAVWKAGAAYVPIDPEYPAERVRFMLEDAGAAVVLTKDRIADLAPASALAARNVSRAPMSPEQLAYVIYTSGSTGRPKGVPIKHASLFNLICWHQRAYDVAPADRATQVAAPAFDGAVWEVWPYLTAGASVHIPDEATRLDDAQIVRWLAAEQITLSFLPTPLAEAAMRNEWPQSLALRVLLTGGDKLNQRPVPGLPFRLVNHYGPTENTVVSTCAEVHAESALDSAPPIGRPLPNTRAYVLDRYLQPVPVGVPGELLVGGVQLAPGYWNRPELTAEKFVADPFEARPGARLYKTGDLVRWAADGNIEFLGRIDHQVKIRGFRIELGEIEALLQQHPAVRECVVLAREDAPGDKRLVAYLTSASGSPALVGELRSLFMERLPAYMVPAAFVVLPAFPLTPNGKLDRKALPAPDVSAALEASFVAPQAPNERILADIWSQVLRVARVGVRDNFFELGGDSILSIQVVAKAQAAGLRITPKQIFQHPRIAELALVAETTSRLASEEGPVSGELPLTPIQHWFFEHDFADAHHWNQAMLLELRDRLDPVWIDQALRQLVIHHDALRLRFQRRDGGWRQVNAATDESASLKRIDYSELSEREQDSAMQRASAELQAQLGLAQGPLLRAAWLDLGPRRRSRLLIAIHHLAVDGVSWRILLEDLHTACEQLRRGEAIKLAAKTSSFKQWAERLREYARSTTCRQQAAYWLAASPSEPGPLPVDFERGINSEASGRVVAVTLDAETTRALLQRVPQAYKTQINDVLLSALALVLGRWTGQRTVAFDLEGHGREDFFEDTDLSRTVGWFTNLFPVRLDLRGAAGPDEVLKSVKEQLRRIPQHGFGYGLLKYLSGDAEIAAQLRAMPQPQVLFNYLGQFDQALPAGSPFALLPEAPGPTHSPNARRGHLLEINSRVSEGELRLDWSYSENVHRHGTIERLAQSFLSELRNLILHCTSAQAGGYTPSDFPDAGLNQEALDRLLSELSEQAR